MDSPQLFLGYIAGAIALVSMIPYIMSIFRGHSKPERATYAIWSFVNLLMVASYFASGARETIWVSVVYAISSLLVFGLSFKYGMGGLNKFDVVCLVIAFIGIFVWLGTKNPEISLYTYIGIKLLGYLPTLKKAYRYPSTENTLSWTMCAVASTLNIFAIASWRPEIALLPIYTLLADGILAVVLISTTLKKKSGFKKELAELYEI